MTRHATCSTQFCCKAHPTPSSDRASLGTRFPSCTEVIEAWKNSSRGDTARAVGETAMLTQADFSQESTLHLVLRLRGGAKKRKKKSYTTPKKNKHKRKKVKLAVLKYYKVDENGKISRLRRECPADECGAGVFMASHFDRHYCGKCCLTYCFNKPEDK
ncbi:ubiquitin and ribosomal protein S27a precursor-like protein-like [Scleropages formosus]|uniref:Ubiquitin and ribosomal protein S27a-like protein-like n=1 Tax=Scleropages formosus TaxID=113540 RepID=A0A0P7ZCQ3_SCLFO|nr:ubiquitin and ribosomal protein S27a precursor-like protein-like [Scleropages formosus]